ncbi:MAG: hypothetical protein LBP43_04295 [Treponema sp.]|jgi:hypothetical protein|nr:hypothetical protein [Treponema sp.]
MMTEPEHSNQGKPVLLGLVPPVLRARGFRLYTQGGGRLVDLWQYGGAAILGHTPAGILRSLKNTAERGLFVPFPHPLENRLRKALSRLFPDRVFRLYPDTLSLRRALIQAGLSGPGEWPFYDPALSSNQGRPPDSGPEMSSDNPARFPDRPLSLWRPFLEGPEGPPSPASPFVPVLPWPAAPRVLVLEPEQAHPFPPPDLIPPVFLAAALRGVYDLIAAGPERGVVKFRHIKKALSQSKWRRRGIYLSLTETLAEEDYAGLFRRFLEQGFLLPPAQDQPLILPACLSPGEEAKLAQLLVPAQQTAGVQDNILKKSLN